MVSQHLLILALALGNDPNTIQKCFSFGVGATLATLLLILAMRPSEEQRAVRLGFALCTLIFTVSACVAQVGYSVSQSFQSPVVVLATDFAFLAAVTWPVTILGLWAQGPFSSSWRRKLGRVVIGLAAFSAVILTIAHMAGWLPTRTEYGMPSPLDSLLAAEYNGLLFFWVGAFVFLPGRLRGWLSWISVAALLAGMSFSTVHTLEENFGDAPLWLHSVVNFARPFNVVLLVAGGLFGLSRFRFSDIFAQRGLRILLGAFIALATASLARLMFGPTINEEPSSVKLAVLGFAIIIWIAIILYAKITAVSDWLVDRQIFRQTDYRRALKSFREAISAESDGDVIFETGRALAKNTLRIADAIIRPDDDAEESADTVRCDYGHEYAFHISTATGQPGAALVITTGADRHTLFNAETDFLREVCLTIERRLEAIDRERENIDRARREAHLVKQLVEAELRALRAQINPHFLFNSLNSIAALITAEPEAAEEMIIRLAKIFRHVLTYHDRPFSSVNEEIAFLQTYLEIEKVRFGDRLQVNFDIEESTSQLAIPTFILQPLVENSLKHGLGPKVGENLLIIRARQTREHLELTVEDNGVGANVTKKLSGRDCTGLGLRNVEERLQTVYRGDAQFTFESVPRLGSRAQILIPITRKNQIRAEAADVLRN
ncbi:MAG: histidine kinase [Verrucomicrobia bacterium]|nr:histidine kinase [Verrucomicrobiota bacterium]